MDLSASIAITSSISSQATLHDAHTPTPMLPQSGPIRREFELAVELDHRDKRLSAWVRNPSGSGVRAEPFLELGSGAFDAAAEARAVLKDQAVMVCLAADAPAELRSLVNHLAARPDLRLYIAASSPENADWFQNLVTALHPASLVRKVSSLPFSFVAAEEKAWVALGARGESARWLLETDEPACAPLRSFFGHAFWRKARRECLPATGSQFSDVDPNAGRPRTLQPLQHIDLPGGELGPSPSVRFSESASHAFFPTPGAVCAAPPGATYLVTPPGGDDAPHDALARAAADGARIGWEKLVLPPLVIASGARPLEIHWEWDDAALLLRLPRHQAVKVKQLLEDAATAGEWRYAHALRLRDAKGDVWARGQAKVVTVVDAPTTIRSTKTIRDLAALREPRALVSDLPFEGATRSNVKLRISVEGIPASARMSKESEAWKAAADAFRDGLARLPGFISEVRHQLRNAGDSANPDGELALVENTRRELEDRRQGQLLSDEDGAREQLERLAACVRELQHLMPVQLATTAVEPPATSKTCKKKEKREKKARARAAAKAGSPPEGAAPAPLVNPLVQLADDLLRRIEAVENVPRPPVGFIHHDGDREIIAIDDWSEFDAACRLAERTGARVLPR